MTNCLKCNSDKIILNALVMDTGQYASGVMQVAFDEEPDALIFKQRTTSTVKIFICGNCGYIEFYAAEPEKIYQAYQNLLSNNQQKEKNL